MPINREPRRIILLEGGNCTGKSTTLEKFCDKIVDTTNVFNHNFYFKLAERLKDSERLANYNTERVMRQYGLAFESVEDYVIVRGHVSDLSLCEFFQGREPVEKLAAYADLEQLFNTLGGFAFLLDVSDDRVLYDRWVHRKVRHVAPENLSPNLKTFECTKRLRDLYKKWFERSKMKNAFVIDTAYKTPFESVEYMLQKLNEGGAL